MKILRRILRKETGQTLPMALLLLFLGALAIVPTLVLSNTNLKATQETDLHTRELYAADAGIDNALWYLQSETRTEIINHDLDWTNPIIYHLNTYQTGETVNNKDVLVQIGTAWLLHPLFDPPTSEPAAGTYYNANHHIAGDNLWTVFGAFDISDNSTYVIQISTAGDGQTYFDHIGVWLPYGYEYHPGSVKINGVPIGGPGTNYTYVKAPTSEQDYRGGKVYRWSYSDTYFKTLSDIAPPPGSGVTPADRYPPSVTLSFKYDVTPFKQAKGVFPWMRLNTGAIAWDTTSGYYHIQSTSFTPPSDNTTAEAYVPRGLTRYIGGSTGSASAVQGDYIAIGNSLMTCCWHNYGTRFNPNIKAGPPCDYDCSAYNCLGKYYTESSATIDGSFGPSDAKIEKAFLYWTAWKSTDNPDLQVTLKVNGALVGTDGIVTQDTRYTLSCSPGYQYACKADVSDRVKAITTTLRNTKFTVSDVDATPATTCDSSTANQFSNAAWSMIIIYSSQDPAVGVHQIYVYDYMFYLYGGSQTVSQPFTISGFKAPDTNIDAKVGYFVAEGDPQYSSDYFEFKGQQSATWYSLGDLNATDKNYYKNVYNSYSTATGFSPGPPTLDYPPGGATGMIGGVDLDIYTKDKDGKSLSSIVKPGDTQAQIRVRTTGDAIRMIYEIFSVTSTAVTPGEEFNVGSMSYGIE